MNAIVTSRYRWKCEDAHDCLQTELMRFFLDQRSYPKSEAPSDYRETNLQELTNENSSEFQLIFTEGFTSAQIKKINLLFHDHMKRFKEHEEILKLWKTFCNTKGIK